MSATSLPLRFESERLRSGTFFVQVLPKLDYLLSGPVVDQYEKADGSIGSYSLVTTYCLLTNPDKGSSCRYSRSSVPARDAELVSCTSTTLPP